MAADLSERLGWLSINDVNRIEAILLQTGLPVTLPEALSPEKVRQLMAVDKKARNGQIYLVLLKQIGKAIVTNDFDDNALDMTLQQYSREKRSN